MNQNHGGIYMVTEKEIFDNLVNIMVKVTEIIRTEKDQNKRIRLMFDVADALSNVFRDKSHMINYVA